MTEEEKKADIIVKTIGEESRLNADNIRRDADKMKRNELAKARADAQKRGADLLRAERRRIDAETGHNAARAVTDARGLFFEERESIRGEVFDKVREKLRAFTKSDAYPALVADSVRAMKELFGSDPAVIFVRPADLGLADAIKEVYTGCTVQTDPSIDIGGVIGVCEKRALRADDTLDKRLAGQSEWFCDGSGLCV